MYLPVNLRIEGRRCVVIGGGNVARRKCGKLAEHGARVLAVALEFCDDPVWARPEVTVLRQAYARGVLEGAFLAIAATDDPQVNARVAEDAAALGILHQCADRPDGGDFTLPATLRQGPLSVSFATEGIMPALAARLKAEAAGVYDRAYAGFCRLVEEIRREPWWTALESCRREAALERMAGCGAIELVRAGDEAAARERLRECIHDEDHRAARGRVCLIGAGPGDPGLLTLKGAQALRQAEVVLYDAHANPALLDLYCPGAERIDVSKHKGSCRQTQDEINALLVAHARSGRIVARLKGGDPLVFGRGGEEARVLAAQGIPFEIIPGVSSALAAPAYAGIPVTDRAYASSVGFYSIHKKSGQGLSDEEWRRMARGPDTLVLLMGCTVLPVIAEKLIQFGRPGATPVALITRGTSPAQTRYLGTLETILSVIEGRELEGPGLVVVGDVVSVIPAMDWFPGRTVSAVPEGVSE